MTTNDLKMSLYNQQSHIPPNTVIPEKLCNICLPYVNDV